MQNQVRSRVGTGRAREMWNRLVLHKRVAAKNRKGLSRLWRSHERSGPPTQGSRVREAPTISGGRTSGDRGRVTLRLPESQAVLLKGPVHGLPGTFPLSYSPGEQDRHSLPSGGGLEGQLCPGEQGSQQPLLLSALPHRAISQCHIALQRTLFTRPQ